jgi:hypothetical protein
MTKVLAWNRRYWPFACGVALYSLGVVVKEDPLASTSALLCLVAVLAGLAREIRREGGVVECFTPKITWSHMKTRLVELGIVTPIIISTSLLLVSITVVLPLLIFGHGFPARLASALLMIPCAVLSVVYNRQAGVPVGSHDREQVTASPPSPRSHRDPTTPTRVLAQEGVVGVRTDRR